MSRPKGSKNKPKTSVNSLTKQANNSSKQTNHFGDNTNTLPTENIKNIYPAPNSGSSNIPHDFNSSFLLPTNFDAIPINRDADLILFDDDDSKDKWRNSQCSPIIKEFIEKKPKIDVKYKINTLFLCFSFKMLLNT